MKDLKALYEDRYSGGMRFLTSRPGVHSVILDCICQKLPGARVLDVGCGAGRLSLMCAGLSSSVHGIDMSVNAVELARAGAKATGLYNVSFEAADVSRLPDGPFDLVLLSEVIEHLSDPLETLRRIHRRLNPGGSLVVSCPSFVNFRGYLWMVLQETFQLLMSPSDLRQVYPADIEKWCREAGFSMEQHIGLCYEWAWTNEAASDLKQRIRLAIGDKKKETGVWEHVETNTAALEAYLDAQAGYHRLLLDDWISRDVLVRARDWSVRLIDPNALKETPGLIPELTAYLKDRRIHYSLKSPVNHMGAGAAYLLCRE